MTSGARCLMGDGMEGRGQNKQILLKVLHQARFGHKDIPTRYLRDVGISIVKIYFNSKNTNFTY